MATHVLKQTHDDDGEKWPIRKQVFWCGQRYVLMEVAFQNAQHALLSALNGDAWGRPICRECLGAIKEAVDVALDEPPDEDE